LGVRRRCQQYKCGGAESRGEKIDTCFHIFVFPDLSEIVLMSRSKSSRIGT
jgi:hypothetical protein